MSQYGISPTQAKVMAIQQLPAPSNLTELRSVLGFTGYYRQYVPNYSSIATPLNRLLQKDVHYQWGPECDVAFQQLKDGISKPGNALRRFDPLLPTTLYTDWSNKGLGALITQEHDGVEYVVACISRSLNKHEKNYGSPKGETLAAVWAMKVFRPYLHGIKFKLVTDHQALKWILRTDQLTGQFARWALSLMDYDFTIEHRPGKDNIPADTFSRFPSSSTSDVTGARLDEDTDPVFNPVLFTHYVAQCGQPVSEDISLLAVMQYHSLVSNIDEYAPRTQMWVPDYLQIPAGIDTPQTQDNSVNHIAAQAVRRYKRTSQATTSTHVVCRKQEAAQRNFWLKAPQGVVVLELFGGLCAGLEMGLRNDLSVSQYFYCDISKAASTCAAHRLQQMSNAYPALLPETACKHAFALPQNVREWNESVVLDFLKRVGSKPILLVAGWECQDLSSAGNLTGLQGKHSNTFYDLVRILRLLQQHSKGPVAHVLENTAFQFNFNSEQISKDHFAEVCTHIGHPVVLDAARFGSHAHRLRNFWTNLAPQPDIQKVAYQIERKPSTVNSILDPGRITQLAPKDDQTPFYKCNRRGQPLQALPTLMAATRSYSFRDGKSGQILDKASGNLIEPNVSERERALGYATGTTAAPGLTQLQRHQITGRCMDANTLHYLFAISKELHVANTQHPFSGERMGGGAAPKNSENTSYSLRNEDMYKATLTAESVHHSNFVSAIADKIEKVESDLSDICTDENTLYYLRQQVYKPDWSTEEKQRVQKRSKSYRIENNTIYRLMTDSTIRAVPHPSVRPFLISQTHDTTGHWGEKRTLSLLATRHWWRGMSKEVKSYVRKCPACDRQRAVFNVRTAKLNPLPINGMFYRWGVDLFGPVEASVFGSRYVMVCIEHFSKHIELIPIPSKEAIHTRRAFLHHILAKYGACAEVVTDGGGEFQGVFDSLLTDSFIDHRVTAPNHPQADGLAERAVKSVKAALSRMCAGLTDIKQWEEQLAWVALGYRCAKQASTGVSPYELLYVVKPTIPPAIVERFPEPIDYPSIFDDPQKAAKSLLERAVELRRLTIMAGGNQKIAQHRDTLRYATVRGGGYLPRLKKFEVGDFVYVRTAKKANTLKMVAKPTVLRIQAIKGSTLLLQGKDGQTITNNIVNVAPCHLPNIDPTIDIKAAKPQKVTSCEICNFVDDEAQMLLCDKCGLAYHSFCLDPPLTSIPEGDWFCKNCIGKSSKTVRFNVPVQEDEDREPDELDKEEERTKSKHKEIIATDKARALESVRISRKVRNPETNQLEAVWGELQFNGDDSYPHLLTAKWDEGESELVTLPVARRLASNAGEYAAVLAAISSLSIEDLPAKWDLHDPRQLMRTLQVFMPGHWDKSHVTKVSQHMPGGEKFLSIRNNPAQGSPACVATGRAELDSLLDVLIIPARANIFDPWAGSGGISKELRRRGYKVLTNDINQQHDTDLHADALQPGLYQQILRRGEIDVIILSPWFMFLDVALPLAVLSATACVCAHIPGHYLTNGVLARLKYLKEYMLAGCVHIILGLDRGPMGMRCAWLVIFASKETKDRMLRTENVISSTLTLP